jgi:hypothetical protein
MSCTDWALAVTAPNAENRVSERLDRIKLPHHIFLRKSIIAHLGRLVPRYRPAFPRYVIVPPQSCYSLREIADIKGMVAFGGQLAIIKHQTLEDLIAVCGGGRILPDPPMEDGEYCFHLGDEVTVTCLNEAKGFFQHSNHDGRAVILMPWLGRSVYVNVNECDLRKVQRKEAKKKKRRQRQRRIRAKSDRPIETPQRYLAH